MIFSTCNYRCDYCFLSEERLGEKVKIVASPAEWRAAFDRTEQTWLLHITGGEPTHYPDFVELAELLTERHYLSLNSNLTGPSIRNSRSGSTRPASASSMPASTPRSATGATALGLPAPWRSAAEAGLPADGDGGGDARGAARVRRDRREPEADRPHALPQDDAGRQDRRALSRQLYRGRARAVPPAFIGGGKGQPAPVRPFVLGARASGPASTRPSGATTS